MIGTTINDRYRLEEELGKGGMGIVYRGHDITLDRHVAVKVLSRSDLGTEGQARLLLEAQVVAKLDHPNIVAVHDAGVFEGNPYIVMQFVEGETLAENKPENLKEIIAIVAQICQALVHAHKNEIVHRDLKPENVLIDASGNVKLMDFGLARSVTSRLTSEGMIVGTVFYLAPELAMGQEFDGRADLYALGVMLYELSTGELPFVADDQVAVISQHLHAPVVPPRAKKKDIPPLLNDLIVRLMSKDPSDRPSSAREVLKSLETSDIVDTEAAPAEELLVLDRIVRGKMVGRRKQVEESRTLWNKASAGEGQVLLISGEPGIGKTRFVRELITLVEVSGGVALLGASYTEGGMPYAAFRQILRKGMRNERVQALAVPEDILLDLLSLVPEMRTSYPKISDDKGKELPDQGRLFESFTVFTNMLCEQAPLLLVLEDVHWADSGTLSLLRHLARNIQETQVMIAATYREVELDEARPFHEVLLDLDREKIPHRLKLTRLNKNQTREMLAALFAEGITPEFLEGIYRETEGNPFFIEEVCKALVESGQVYYVDGVWDHPSMEKIGIPQSVRVAIQSRLSQLPAESQKVLQQAAVIGREFGYQVLRSAAKLGEDTLLEALEDAERAQLIEDISEQDQVRLAFVHAMIPTTLVESVRILERRRLHRRAGSAIEVLHPDNIQALAYHYLQAGETEKAVDYLIQVGDQARILYAHREAIDSYLQAIDFLKEHERLERTARTLMKLGLTYQNNFQFAESSQAFQEAFTLRQRIDETRVEERPPPASHAYRMMGQEPGTLDPGLIRDFSSIFAIDNIFRGLIDWSPAYNIIPDVAHSWEVLDEGRKYIFHLREDVYWTDGVQVTAQDFEFAIKRILDQGFNARNTAWLFVIKNAAEYYQGELADPGQIGVRAVDDLTIEIELETPVGYFLHLMAFTAVMPVPRQTVEKYGEDWTDVDKIITNGPFKLISWKRGESMVYEKNPAYSGHFPGNLERIEFTSLQNAEDPLRVYDEDIIEHLLLGDLPSDQQDRARHRCASEYISFPRISTQYFGFDVTCPPFDDIRVRRAFTFAIDREFLSGSILRGYYSPASGGFLPPGMPGHSPGIGLSYDPEQARHLIAEAGYPEGRGFPALEALIPGAPIRLTLADYSHAQWLEVLGVEVGWQSLKYGDWQDRLAAEKPHLWWAGWQADVPDPHNFLSLDNWHKDRKRGVLWKNQAYNQLVEKAGETMDQKERINLYQQADKILIEEAPILPLLYMSAHFLVKPWVKGFPKSGLSRYQLKNVIIEPH